jgi:hypothetical protein
MSEKCKIVLYIIDVRIFKNRPNPSGIYQFIFISIYILDYTRSRQELQIVVHLYNLETMERK